MQRLQVVEVECGTVSTVVNILGGVTMRIEKILEHVFYVCSSVIAVALIAAYWYFLPYQFLLVIFNGDLSLMVILGFILLCVIGVAFTAFIGILIICAIKELRGEKREGCCRYDC